MKKNKKNFVIVKNFDDGSEIPIDFLDNEQQVNEWVDRTESSFWLLNYYRTLPNNCDDEKTS